MKLFKEAFQLEESQCKVISDKSEGIQIAKDAIRHHRSTLQVYINTHTLFSFTLKPVPVPNEPLVVKLMAEAAEKANVGPMAAVAGILADLAVKRMTAAGCKVAVVENGGEISGTSDTHIDVAVAVGDDPLSKRFGFRLTEFPIGIATSSGRFSHAFSFGDAEAAIVFCKDAGLADAVATAVCNVVKGEAHEAAIQTGMEKALSIQGVEGVMIIFKGLTGTAGKIPKIIKVDPISP